MIMTIKYKQKDNIFTLHRLSKMVIVHVVLCLYCFRVYSVATVFGSNGIVSSPSSLGFFWRIFEALCFTYITVSGYFT